MANHDLTTILSSMLQDIPQVQIGTHLHHTNFLVRSKVFAFIQGDGVVIKLPKATIQALVEANQAAPLVMGKRVMREWVVIKHDHPEEYRQDEALFKEAMMFVATKA